VEGLRHTAGVARVTSLRARALPTIVCGLCLVVASGCSLDRRPELYGPPYVPGKTYNAWQVLVALEELTGQARTSGYNPPDWKPFASDTRQRVLWVRVPAGTFQMGCAARSSADVCLPDERPVHAVRITRAFDMMATEVTRTQFLTYWLRSLRIEGIEAPRDDVVQWVSLDEAMQDALIEHRFVDALAAMLRDERPMVGISWQEARAFCKWLGGRLPTEAEWEYAARGGIAGGTYPWGDEPPTCERAHFGACGSGSLEPRAVGQDPPNEYGLHDMAGNVREWVADWYQETAYAHASSTDPAGPGTGLRWKPKDGMGPFAFLGLLNWERAGARVIRGGDSASSTVRLRVAFRWSGQSVGDSDAWKLRDAFTRVGCRCVRDTR